MKYIFFLLALSVSSTLYADVAHGRRGTAVHTSNGTAVHRRGSSTVRSTNGAYHAGGANGVYRTNGAAFRRGGATIIHTDNNWNDSYWQSNRYGYWNGHRGYWHMVSGDHIFVVVD